MSKCIAITKNGKGPQCSRNAVEDKYCRQHHGMQTAEPDSKPPSTAATAVTTCLAMTKAGLQCSRPAVVCGLCKQHHNLKAKASAKVKAESEAEAEEPPVDSVYFSKFLEDFKVNLLRAGYTRLQASQIISLVPSDI